MRYALDLDGNRIEASPAGTGTCPACRTRVVAKCGRIYTWHWAHTSRDDCDPWSEPTTTWHHDWQEQFQPTNREIVIGPHRADIAIPSGILELQHSHLPVDTIQERERFYSQFGHFAWLFDATDAWLSGRFDLRRPRDDSYRTFRWKHARRSITAATAPTYLDLGIGVLRLGRMHPEAPTGGWGHLLTNREFIAEFAVAAYHHRHHGIPGGAR